MQRLGRFDIWLCARALSATAILAFCDRTGSDLDASAGSWRQAAQHRLHRNRDFHPRDNELVSATKHFAHRCTSGHANSIPLIINEVWIPSTFSERIERYDQPMEIFRRKCLSLLSAGQARDRAATSHFGDLDGAHAHCRQR
jgi:hypothetical protein